VLWWLVDNALLLYLLLGCALLAVGAYWWMTRKRQFLIATGGVAGLLILVWLLTQVVVTDRGRIEGNIRAMAAAIGENKPADVVKHLARDFQFGTYTKATAERDIRSAIHQYGLQEIRVRDVSITKLSRAEGKAEAEFRVFVWSSMTEGGGYPFWCKAEFVLEDEDWRLRRIRIFQGFVNTDQEFHP
jgi:hypothetical protein